MGGSAVQRNEYAKKLPRHPNSPRPPPELLEA